MRRIGQMMEFIKNVIMETEVRCGIRAFKEVMLEREATQSRVRREMVAEILEWDELKPEDSLAEAKKAFEGDESKEFGQSLFFRTEARNQLRQQLIEKLSLLKETK
jgi:predicted  nucleic acid-binding Zn-ribbon protein